MPFEYCKLTWSKNKQYKAYSIFNNLTNIKFYRNLWHVPSVSQDVSRQSVRTAWYVHATANRRCVRVCDQHVKFSKVTSVAARHNRPAKTTGVCHGNQAPWTAAEGHLSHTHTHRM